MMEPAIFRPAFQRLVSRFGVPTKGERWEALKNGYFEVVRHRATDKGIVIACDAAFADADRLPKPNALLALVPDAERVGVKSDPNPMEWPTDSFAAWTRNQQDWRDRHADLIEVCGEPPRCMTEFPTGEVDYWYTYLQTLLWLAPAREDAQAEAEFTEAWLTERGWTPGDIKSSRAIVIPFVGPQGMQAAINASAALHGKTVRTGGRK